MHEEELGGEELQKRKLMFPAAACIVNVIGLDNEAR